MPATYLEERDQQKVPANELGSDAGVLHAGARNTTVSEVLLPNSYHVATLDYDKHTIFDGSVDFIESTVAGRDSAQALAP